MRLGTPDSHRAGDQGGLVAGFSISAAGSVLVADLFLPASKTG
jgi:hypothetical protein